MNGYYLDFLQGETRRFMHLQLSISTFSPKRDFYFASLVFHNSNTVRLNHLAAKMALILSLPTISVLHFWALSISQVHATSLILSVLAFACLYPYRLRHRQHLHEAKLSLAGSLEKCSCKAFLVQCVWSKALGWGLMTYMCTRMNADHLGTFDTSEHVARFCYNNIAGLMI